MTQPLSFNPTRSAREARIVAASDGADRAPAAAPGTIPSAKPLLPPSKLTALARELASREPPVDPMRVAKIGNAIAAGDYPIDAGAIADAMLRYYTDVG